MNGFIFLIILAFLAGLCCRSIWPTVAALAADAGYWLRVGVAMAAYRMRR